MATVIPAEAKKEANVSPDANIKVGASDAFKLEQRKSMLAVSLANSLDPKNPKHFKSSEINGNVEAIAAAKDITNKLMEAAKQSPEKFTAVAANYGITSSRQLLNTIWLAENGNLSNSPKNAHKVDIVLKQMLGKENSFEEVVSAINDYKKAVKKYEAAKAKNTAAAEEQKPASAAKADTKAVATSTATHPEYLKEVEAAQKRMLRDGDFNKDKEGNQPSVQEVVADKGKKYYSAGQKSETVTVAELNKLFGLPAGKKFTPELEDKIKLYQKLLVKDDPELKALEEKLNKNVPPKTLIDGKVGPLTIDRLISRGDLLVTVKGNLIAAEKDMQ